MSKLLTDLELKVMNVLWELRKGFVKDILANWPESDPPAYNTVSTILRILEEKEFVGHKAYGRSHEYFPLTKQEIYQSRALGSMIKDVFAGSMTSLVSALAEQRNLSNTERKALQKLIDAYESNKA